MDRIYNLNNNDIFYISLVFSRIAASLTALPGIGETYVTPMIRIFLSLFLAMLIYPIVTAEVTLPMPENFFQIGGYLISEAIIGLLFGTIARILISAAGTAGSIISMQSGLASANIFDPSQGRATSLESSLYNMMVMTLFFSLDIHYVFIEAVVASYDNFPLFSNLPIEDMTYLISHTVNESFAISFKLASPFIAVGTALFLGGGLLARLMPSIQIFFILLPIQITVIFSIIYITLAFAVSWFMEYVAEKIASI